MEPLLSKIRQTKRFIDANPSDVVLTRNVRADDGAGGYVTTPTDLTSQVMRVVQQRQGVAVERRNVSGETVDVAMTLVCMPDADVMRGDTLTWQGLAGEVVWITDLQYVKHAEVAI